MDETDEIEVVLTCGTLGCMNEGVPIPMLVPHDAILVCGPCATEITTIEVLPNQRKGRR